MKTEIPLMVFDSSAFTSRELMRLRGGSRTRINKEMKRLIQQGTWERVWKRLKTRSVPAYRPTKTGGRNDQG